LSIIDNRFRLADDAAGMGLRCSAEGVSLAGTPLLRETVSGFEPRQAADLEALLEAAYGVGVDPAPVSARLAVAARALNQGDLARAMVATVQMRLPSLDQAAVRRLSRAEQALKGLAKYDADEPRDWHGRWTTGAGGSPAAAPAAAPKPAAKPAAKPSPKPQQWGEIYRAAAYAQGRNIGFRVTRIWDDE